MEGCSYVAETDVTWSGKNKVFFSSSVIKGLTESFLLLIKHTVVQETIRAEFHCLVRKLPLDGWTLDRGQKPELNQLYNSDPVCVLLYIFLFVCFHLDHAPIRNYIFFLMNPTFIIQVRFYVFKGYSRGQCFSV